MIWSRQLFTNQLSTLESFSMNTKQTPINSTTTLNFTNLLSKTRFNTSSLMTIIFSGFIHHPMMTYTTLNEDSSNMQLLLDSTKLMIANYIFSPFHSKVLLLYYIDNSYRNMWIDNRQSA